MNKFLKKSAIPAIMAAGLGVLMLSPAANAEEGGTGHYLPDSVATLIDVAPTVSELDTKNRLEGDYFWFKAAWQF